MDQKGIGRDVQFLSCTGMCFVIWMCRRFGTKCAWLNSIDKGSALSVCRSVLTSDEAGISSQFPPHEGNDDLKLSGPHLISVFQCKITLERKFLWYLLRNSYIKK